MLKTQCLHRSKYLIDYSYTKIHNVIMKIKKITLSFFIILNTMVAFADDSTLIKEFENKAHKGNLQAQLFIADYYYRSADFNNAIKYYELASQQENSKAQYELGIIYYMGFAGNVNYVKSKFYFELAAKQNNVDAETALGMLYYKGLGVEKDYMKAVEMFEKAAKQNHPPAQTYLGIMYSKGHGVEQDLIKGLSYYKTACINGDQTGCYYYKKQ